MKVLHITYHSGCKLTIDFVMQQLGYEVTTQFANWNYNISHKLAAEIWEKYKDFYHQFDVIITSDTGPLSRIFLQNNYAGKLIIWCCNRFDYADEATNDCGFPDQEYYKLFREASSKPNVKIFSYTKFEYEYAAKYKNVTWNKNIIRPYSSIIELPDFISSFPKEINKSDTFFIPPYHNDTIYMNLKQKCDELGIPAYAGRYNGPQDLKGIKGIIHIPYGWAFLAMFENLALGNVYYLPSKRFLFHLAKYPNFWWQDAYAMREFIDSAEYYLPEHQDLFVYFDNWEHLKNLVKDENLRLIKQKKALEFSKAHAQKSLNQWKEALNNW